MNLLDEGTFTADGTRQSVAEVGMRQELAIPEGAMCSRAGSSRGSWRDPKRMERPELDRWRHRRPDTEHSSGSSWWGWAVLRNLSRHPMDAPNTWRRTQRTASRFVRSTRTLSRCSRSDRESFWVREHLPSSSDRDERWRLHLCRCCSELWACLDTTFCTLGNARKSVLCSARHHMTWYYVAPLGWAADRRGLMQMALTTNSVPQPTHRTLTRVAFQSLSHRISVNELWLHGECFVVLSYIP